ncbi:hypothetical protein DNFV4_00319 [Nitrospira tepida]|uniref:Uncharacterized protein n=1 Tax=Nitrospira tepida TaxID=2973512 RepID=A0AA86T0X6_9BACT|nr:hypothetical protein [Nitrospira tepida]CAI4029899.1 hypothetical protein DNFV4_00319 [Nitrospira tepida]
MDWNTFVTTLTATGFASAAFVFLAKFLSKHLLSMDLERFKADLKSINEKELERLRADLRIAAFQQETTFAKLHEKRAEAIAELYAKLVDAHSAIRIALIYGKGGQPDYYREALSKFRAFEDYFEPRKIYFPDGLCDLIEQLVIKLGLLQRFAGERAPDDLTQGIQDPKGFGAKILELDEPVKQIRHEIEHSFRNILGITEHQPVAKLAELEKRGILPKGR